MFARVLRLQPADILIPADHPPAGRCRQTPREVRARTTPAEPPFSLLAQWRVFLGRKDAASPPMRKKGEGRRRSQIRCQSLR